MLDRPWIARVTALLIAGVSGCMALTAAVPLGHADFYPSPERPVGWRGDGTGAWPGATPVTSWDASTGMNIVWKTPMPSLSWSQPVVVGDRVFVNADPNILLCVSAVDGRILWQREVDHTALMSPEQAAFVRGEIAFFRGLWDTYTQWRLDLMQFYKDAAAAGIDTNTLKGGKRGETLGGTGGAALPVELKARYDALLALQTEHSFFVKNDGGNGYSINGISGAHKARWAKLVREYDVWFYSAWTMCCTDTFAAPVSDGQHVYVAMANCQTACYDLEGNLKWMVWDHPQGEGNELNFLGTRFVPAPLLVDDLVVVNNNGEIRAYAKRTGEKRWGVVNPYQPTRGGRPNMQRFCRPYPEAVSPIALTLQFDGKPFKVIADGGGNIYRLRDGKVIGTKLPTLDKGATPIAQGDLYIWKTGSDNAGSARGVCRLTAATEDKVEWTSLWRLPRAVTAESSDVYCDGWIYDGRATRYELLTGREEKVASSGCSWSSPIIGGGYLIAFGGSDKRTLASRATLVSTKTLGQVWTGPYGLLDKRKVEDAAFRRRWQFEGDAYDDSNIGNGSPSCAGNRLFMRTGGYLWCIGDPTQEFPLSPDTPAVARDEAGRAAFAQGLAVIRAATDTAVLKPFLTDPRPLQRREAVRRVSALPEARTALSAELQTVMDTDTSAAIRAEAARGLMAANPERALVRELLELIVRGDVRKDPTVPETQGRSRGTMLALGADALPGLVAILAEPIDTTRENALLDILCADGLDARPAGRALAQHAAAIAARNPRGWEAMLTARAIAVVARCDPASLPLAAPCAQPLGVLLPSLTQSWDIWPVLHALGALDKDAAPAADGLKAFAEKHPNTPDGDRAKAILAALSTRK